MSEVNVQFVNTANDELANAIEYYNYQLPGLGSEFYKEINRAINRINKFPYAWTKIGLYTRRCLLKRFPYALYYTLENESILILAIANLHRKPEYYKNRII